MAIAIAVVAAVVVVGFALYRLFANKEFSAGRRNKQARLAVTDAINVGQRHKLVLVRRDDVEHLVMIGGSTEIVVETNIRRNVAARPREQMRDQGLVQAAPDRAAQPPKDSTPKPAETLRDAPKAAANAQSGPSPEPKGSLTGTLKPRIDAKPTQNAATKAAPAANVVSAAPRAAAAAGTANGAASSAASSPASAAPAAKSQQAVPSTMRPAENTGVARADLSKPDDGSVSMRPVTQAQPTAPMRASSASTGASSTSTTSTAASAQNAGTQAPASAPTPVAERRMQDRRSDTSASHRVDQERHRSGSASASSKEAAKGDDTSSGKPIGKTKDRSADDAASIFAAPSPRGSVADDMDALINELSARR